jgi:CubicO group peptidase (beta-lactamase class C family)
MTNLESCMEKVVQSYVADKQFMGAVLVVKNKRTLLDKGYGYANLEWKIPNSPTTKFRIASLTKQFTATAILLLEEQDKLNITDLLNKHLSDAPPSWHNITIFNLLTHTSGIPNYTSFPAFHLITTTKITPKEQINIFHDKPLNFQPGSEYEYSNSGYVLLGYLIEQISGQSYESFVMKNIFKPLKMNNSGYDSHSRIMSYRASGYIKNPKEIHNADYLNMSVPYSAGSLYSTTGDLLRWEEGLFGGKILSTASLKKMIQPFKNNYGFGVRVYFLGKYKVISHAGGTSRFSSKLIYSPDDKLTIIVLANLNTLDYVTQNIALKLLALVHGDKVTLPSDRKELNVPPKEFDGYIGTYDVKPYLSAYESITMKSIIISMKNGRLIAKITDQPKIQLFSESKVNFFSKVPDIQIEFINKKYRTECLILHQHGESSTWLKRH